MADRETVEQQCEELLLLPAKEQDVALLVVGDPFAATTHTDLITRCKQLGVRKERDSPHVIYICSQQLYIFLWQVPVQAVHNASIMNAIGCCGLQLYNFGRTVSKDTGRFYTAA